MSEQQPQTPPAPKEQSKALAPIDLLRRDLSAMESQFKLVLPANIPPERFSRVALTALQQTPSLLKCDRKTLVQEFLKCATDGLIPDGREAAIVPFKGSAKYMPMVGGLVKRMHQTGNIHTITAHVVFKGEEFEYFIDESGEHLRYRPMLDAVNRSEEPHVTFAIIMMKDGAKYIEVLTESDIKAIRNVSKANDGPWNGPFVNEMRKKSALRRVAKRAPHGADLDALLERDNEFYDLNGKDNTGVVDVPPMQAEKISDDQPRDVTPQKQEAQNGQAKKTVVNHAQPIIDAAAAAAGKNGASPTEGQTVAGHESGPEAAGSVSPDSSSAPTRGELVKEVQGHLKSLGLNRADGEAKILKLTGKTPGQLTTEELAQLADVLHIEVMEKNPNAK